MSTYLPLIAERLRRPLLVLPTAGEALLDLVADRVSPTSATPVAPEASRFVGRHRDQTGQPRLARREGRTALVDVVGGLVNRGAWVGADFCTGLVSYEGLRAQLREIAADPKVENVILDIDSPGGEAAGMFSLAAAIRDLRRTKHVVAVIDDMAASAGYGIAASADEIIVSPTSVVGSIGVVMLHLDKSKNMERRGVTPTFIYAGAHKVDGHAFAPLPDDVRADLQRDVAAFYDQFLATVAAGRGRRLSASAAQKTDARTFIGADAVKAGLADRIGSLDEVLAELNRPSRARTSSQPKGPSTMHYGEPDPTALAAARTAERARIKSILTLPEAQGRQSSAMAFALDSDMAPEAAKAALAGIPVVSGATTTPAPDQRQAGPEMGPGGPDAAAAAAQAKAGWAKAFNRD